MEKFAKLVFSPTGGTQKVADALVANWGSEIEQIDLCDADLDFGLIEIPSDGLVLIAVPSFGGRVPSLAAKRIAAIRGNGAKAVLACVYGNRAYDDTLLELQDIAKEAGFNVIAAVSAVAEHSMMPQFAAGRPNAADIMELNTFSQKILDAVNGEGKLACPTIPGKRPYVKTGTALAPKAGSACNKCGTCAQLCPAGAIPVSDPRQTDSKLCIGCMRCASACPQKARSLNKIMLKVAALAIGKACSTPKQNELFL